MIPHSALFTDAISYSHAIANRVDLVVGTAVIASNIPVTSGKVVNDRGANTRWSCDLVVGIEPWTTVPIDAYKTRFRVYHGISSIGYTEMVMMGEYRIDELSRNDKGLLSIKGSGLESYMIDARFLRPRTPMYGVDTINAIRQLIVECVPHARFRNEAIQNKKITFKTPWDRDRIEAVTALADSIHSECYADYDGVFVVAPEPNPTKGVPVFTVRVGEGGLLSAQNVTNSRATVYNGVSVAGAQGIFGFAADMNPASPTYWNGEYGQVPRFYSSQYLTTVAQANAAAKSMLATAMARNRRLEIEAGSPLTFLEAGDLIKVGLTDGTFENHIVQKNEVSLSTDGGGSIETMATKIDPGDS